MAGDAPDLKLPDGKRWSLTKQTRSRKNLSNAWQELQTYHQAKHFMLSLWSSSYQFQPTPYSASALRRFSCLWAWQGVRWQAKPVIPWRSSFLHHEVEQILCSFGGLLALFEPLVCHNASTDVIALLPHGTASRASAEWSRLLSHVRILSLALLQRHTICDAPT